MNIIKMYNDYIKEENIGSKIEVIKTRKSEFFSVNKLKLVIKEDADILIEYIGDKNYKLDFYLEVDDNVTCNLTEIRLNTKSKIRNTYILNNKSNLNLQRYMLSNNIRLLDIVNLDGKESNFNNKVRNLCNNSDNYSIIIYHNNEITESNVDYKNINLTNKEAIISVTNVVEPEIADYKIKQNIKIISDNKDSCSIDAYALIGENRINEYSFVNMITFKEEISRIMKTKKMKEYEIREKISNLLLINEESIKENMSLDKLNEYWRWYDE